MFQKNINDATPALKKTIGGAAPALKKTIDGAAPVLKKVIDDELAWLNKFSTEFFAPAAEATAETVVPELAKFTRSASHDILEKVVVPTAQVTWESLLVPAARVTVDGAKDVATVAFPVVTSTLSQAGALVDKEVETFLSANMQPEVKEVLVDSVSRARKAMTQTLGSAFESVKPAALHAWDVIRESTLQALKTVFQLLAAKLDLKLNDFATTSAGAAPVLAVEMPSPVIEAPTTLEPLAPPEPAITEASATESIDLTPIDTPELVVPNIVAPPPAAEPIDVESTQAPEPMIVPKAVETRPMPAINEQAAFEPRDFGREIVDTFASPPLMSKAPKPEMIDVSMAMVAASTVQGMSKNTADQVPWAAFLVAFTVFPAAVIGISEFVKNDDQDLVVDGAPPTTMAEAIEMDALTGVVTPINKVAAEKEVNTAKGVDAYER